MEDRGVGVGWYLIVIWEVMRDEPGFLGVGIDQVFDAWFVERHLLAQTCTRCPDNFPSHAFICCSFLLFIFFVFHLFAVNFIQFSKILDIQN